MSEVDHTIFRTWDTDLRQKRRAKLIEASIKSADVAKVAFHTVKVTGSLSRGEIHPWSDLDLLLFPDVGVDGTGEQPPRAESWMIADVSGLNPDEIDIIHADRIIEPLRKGLLGSAIDINQIPSLGNLPEASLAIARTAIAVETMLPGVVRELEFGEKYLSEDYDEATTLGLQTYVAEACRDRMASRIKISLKRLAVFHDGGQSNWLDDVNDDVSLESLLDRLSSPASLPFERQAILTSGAASSIQWLLNTRYERIDEGKVSYESLVADVKKAIENLSEWAAHLRGLGVPEQTHGLPDEGLVV